MYVRRNLACDEVIVVVGLERVLQRKDGNRHEVRGRGRLRLGPVATAAAPLLQEMRRVDREAPGR